MSGQQGTKIERLKAEIKPFAVELDRLEDSLGGLPKAEAEAVRLRIAELRTKVTPLLEAYVDAEMAPYRAQIETDEVETQAGFEQHRLAQLNQLQRSWERSGKNPAYVWEAFDYCQDGKPLPGWVLTYLKDCRRKLKRLTFPPKGDPWEGLAPADAAQRIPEALGFSRAPNWNAIERRRQDNADAETALEVALRMAAPGREKLCKARGKTAKRRGVQARQIRAVTKRAGALWEE